MKNNFKTYAKKSVSLFLAVLMVMSCWVWMAPEKAEAADNYNFNNNNASLIAGKYYVRIIGNVTDRADKGMSKENWSADYKTSNGTVNGSNTLFTTNHSINTEGNDVLFVKEVFLAGFPTVTKTTTLANYKLSDSPRVENVRLQIYDYLSAAWYDAHDPQAWNVGKKGLTGGTGNTNNFNWSTKEEMYPYIAGFNSATPKNVSTDGDYKVSIPRYDSTSEEVYVTPSFTFNDYHDQYGVKWVSSNIDTSKMTAETPYISKTAGGSPLSSEDESNNIYYDSTNNRVVIKKTLQTTVVPNSDGKVEYFFNQKYIGKNAGGGTVTSTATAKITVLFPSYNVLFDGGVSTAKITADGNTYTGSYTPFGYQGSSIAVPSKTEADGYTFYEYWSKPQPETGVASYNAATVDFAKPCSSEHYASYKDDGGSEETCTYTVNNITHTYKIVIDKNGDKWYDAGKQLDPTSANRIAIEGNINTPDDESDDFVPAWYAYWLSKDLSVKFYDVDGKFLGEKLVKAGQKYNAIEWPTSYYIRTGYTSGAFKYDVDENIWVDIDGTEINKTNTADTAIFSKDIMILTPKITRKTFDSKYTVKFIDPELGEPVAIEGITGNKYDYRANLADPKKDYVSEATSKIAAVPGDVSSDLEFRYELLGWSSVVPTTGKNYHVLLEDANFDVKGTAISLNNDWIVRSDATYYPVYRRFTKIYVVNFNYKDATGADATRELKVKYGANLVPPKEYVPFSYVTKGWGYKFKCWEYQTNKGIATLDYDKTISFTNENIQIAGSALDDGQNVKPIIINARYFEGVATPYTVTFNYINSKGEETSSNVQVKNEQLIEPEMVAPITPAKEWENDNKLYTYANKWEITEGAATVGVGGAEKKVGDIIDTADLITLTPTSNVTFKAVYANPVPYFTVTYIDGIKTFKARVLQDTNVPAWTGKVMNDNGTPDDTTDDFEEDKIYVPADYEGEGGTYEFQGWFDAVTGGNKYTTADKVTDNLTLYSQFKFVPDTFTITFMNHDGSVQLAAGKYEKGQNIEAIVTTATKAAQGRAKDNTYEYLFLGWDKAVPTFCEGYDVTYTALYKPVYRYYDVKWYNSKLVDGKWVADKTKDTDGVETNLLATTHHTYNSKLYTPSVSNLNCLEAAPGDQVYTFAGWYYNDAQGNAVKFERGMVVTAEMEFYATYTLSDKVYTVTTVVKNETIKYYVAAGNKAEIPVPQAGYVDADKHDAFAGWYTDAEFTTEFDDDAKINADITLYAKFTESAHDISEKELVSAPTYYVEGEMDVWCACDKAKTKKTEAIDKLTDKEIPTGTIYLGGLDSWSSTDEIGGAALDNGEITLYANANTDVIITANDTGDVNALYNPSGLGKGIKVIRAFIYPGKFKTLTADSYGAAQSLTVDVYNDDTQAATNNANFSVKLGDFVVADLDEDGKPQYDENGKVKYKDLVSGESYIVYYYVVDKAGNQLRQKVRTAKFIYDDIKPEFKVEGDSNGAALPTFCGTATVKGFKEEVTLTVNNKAATLTDGEYVINYAEGMDTVTITATDKAGNTFTKKIKVADHSYITTEQAASCGVAGYKKVECINCHEVKSEETYAALAHIWSGRQVIPADCVNNGIVVVTCSICGDEVRTEFEEDDVTPVIPALGHEYAKDAEGNIIYGTVTEATCKTKGLAEAYCSVCGDGRITKELELNPENHEDIKETEVLPDCVNNGYYKKTCSCSTEPLVYIDHEVDNKYKALGHGTIDEDTAEWYVRTEPTCYQTGEKVLKCLVCSNFVEVEGKEVTEVIAATGEHVKTVSNPDTYKEEGVVKYRCATKGCSFKYDDKILENEEVKTYDVTFKAEDGSVIAEFKGVVEGTGISSTDENPITAPAKPNSEDGVYKYTFEGWKDKDGKIYKLPLTVTGDLKLTASYKATKRMYTHQFVVPNTWTSTTAADDDVTVVATLVGAIGDVRKTSIVPSFNAEGDDANYEYTFEGWKRKVAPQENEDFKIIGDATFIAVFTRKPIKYEVVYYSGDDYVWSTEVNAGAAVEFGGTEPTKKHDDVYHYEFDGWYVDEECTTKYVVVTDATGKLTKGAITEKTRLYAGYTAIDHNLVTDTTKGKNGIIQQADCLLPEITAKKCSDEACGYTCEDQTAVALGHDEYKVDENGEHVLVDGKKVINGGNEEIDKVVYYVVRCSRCSEILKQEKVSVTVKFVNWNDAILGRETYETGKEISMPNLAPERAADDKNTYTFSGWSYEDGETPKFIPKDAANLGTATADITFVATYEASTRYYKVTYVDLDNNTLYNHYTEIKDENGDDVRIMGVPYGTALPAYAGTTDPATLKGPKYVEAGHYVFDKWQYDASYIVKGDVVVAPEFKLQAHDKKTDYTDATCTAMGGQTITCTKCDYKATVNATEPALGHAWNEGVVTTAPDYQTQTPGVMTYTCTRCKDTYTKEIAGNSYSIKATVKDANGNPSANVRVELLKKNEAGVYELHMAKNTGADGVVIFAPLTKGEYRVFVTSTNTHYDATVKEDGTVSGGDITAQPENKPVDNSCKCSCHKDNFWGIIYRLIQKIIKFFTGKPSCCACPDEGI